MKKWVRDLLVEGDGNPSIGSLAFLIVVLVYSFDHIWSAVKIQPLRMSSTDIAWLAVSLYGVKKLAPLFQGIKAHFGGKKDDHQPQP